MKKHNEGYALPFVLVVLIVLCIIAVGIMDFSLRNLESQQATIQRMKEKYEAAAMVEQVLAAAQNKKNGSFPQTDAFLYDVDDSENELRIASSSETGNVWVIVKIVPTDEKTTITTIFEDGESNLTIADTTSGKIEVSEYRIVDKTTAWTYVGYDPNAG